MRITTTASSKFTGQHETSRFTKRIGSTVYEVRVYFNQDARETMDDKILRLIRNEAKIGEAVGM